MGGCCNMLKVKIDPNLVVFSFHCKSLSCTVEPLQAFVLFLVMTPIKYGQHQIYVED